MSENTVQNSGQILYELNQKNDQIEYLINENTQYSQMIHNLQSEVFTLKNKLTNFQNLTLQLKSFKEKNAVLEKKILKLEKEILNITRSNKEEKRKIQNKYYDDIKKLKLENEGFKTKIEMTNHLANEKNGLMIAFDKIVQDKNKILLKQDDILREKQINNELKVSKLKKKMLVTVNETQGLIKEHYLDYADHNTKLALLQNQQLIIKYQYQNKLFHELAEKNKILENENFELKRELDIHKEVELSLAKKYKNIKERNDVKTKHLTSYNNSFRKSDSNIRTKKTQKILSLNRKILKLQNDLLIKQNNFEEEKIKNDSIQKIIKGREIKYFGILNYLEECLKLFFNDDFLKSKKDIYIHIDLLKKGDFSKLTKEEKYATLIIMMKYFMQFIYHDNIDNKFDVSKTKVHFINDENNIKYLVGNKTERINSFNFDKKIIRKKIFKKKENYLELPYNLNYNSFDNSINASEKLSLISSQKSKSKI